LSSPRARGSKLTVQAKPFHDLRQRYGRQVIFQSGHGD
jgi:hypothetical protein